MKPAVDLLRRFFAWWMGELAACVPPALRRRLRRRRHLLLLALDDDRLQLRLRKGERWSELGAVALQGGIPTGARDPIERMLRAARNAEVAVALPPHQVLRRLVQLPAAALENLREVLSFEMDRHTPLKAEEVAFDYRLVANDRGTKRISVDLAVAQRSSVEDAARLARSIGCVAGRVCADAADLDMPQPMNLLTAPPAAPVRVKARLSMALIAAVAVLVVVALYLPLHLKRETLATYEAHLAESRKSAMEADALAKKLSTAQSRQSFLVNRKRVEPTVAALLNELSLRVPQDTWLLQLDLRGRQVEFSGFSPRASTLIGEIEGSDMLAEVEFAAPVVKDPALGLEKFQLSSVVSKRRAD